MSYWDADPKTTILCPNNYLGDKQNDAALNDFADLVVNHY